MTVDPDARQFLMGGGGAPSFKFARVGDEITGTVCEQPELRQQVDYTSGEPLTWDDGRPRMQLVVTLQTKPGALASNWRSVEDVPDAEDDGRRRLYVKGKLQQAVRDALLEARADYLEVGGTLTVRYVGDEPNQRNPRLNPAKVYKARWVPAAVGFLNGPGEDDQPAAPAYAQAPTPMPTYPQAAPAYQAPAQPAPLAPTPISDPTIPPPPPGMDPAIWAAMEPGTRAAIAKMQQKIA